MNPFPQVLFSGHCQSINYDNSMKFNRGASGIAQWIRAHAALAKGHISGLEHVC